MAPLQLLMEKSPMSPVEILRNKKFTMKVKIPTDDGLILILKERRRGERMKLINPRINPANIR